MSLRHHKLRNCKLIVYDFYFEELFIVKHKSKIALKQLSFYLPKEIIKDRCTLNYYFNNTSNKACST